MIFFPFHLPRIGELRHALFLAVFFLLYLPLGARAADSPTPYLWQLQRVSWGMKDVIPSGSSDMAQSTDGYLWLAAVNGLFRFDGVRVTNYQPQRGTLPHEDAVVIRADKHNGIWMGWRLGGVTYLRNGEVKNYGEAEGVPRGTVKSMVFDRHGNLWMATLSGVARFDGRNWHRMGKKDGFSASGARVMITDDKGALAVFSEKGMFAWDEQRGRFGAFVPGPELFEAPFVGPDGRVYLLEQGGIRPIDGLGRYAKLDHRLLPGSDRDKWDTALMTHDGYIWNQHGSLTRRLKMPSGFKDEFTTSARPYAGNDVLNSVVAPASILFEDRSGAVWAWSNGNLTRFRKANVVPVIESTSRANTSIQIIPDKNGAMFLSNLPDKKGWSRVASDAVVVPLAPGDPVDAVYKAHDGTIWRAGADRFTATHPDGKVVDIGYPPRQGTGTMIAIAEDTRGAIWVSVRREGVFRYSDGKWERDRRLPGHGGSPAFSMFSDDMGRLWIGYPDNLVVMLDGDTVHTFTAAEGLDVGWPAMFQVAQGALLVGGNAGLQVFRQGRFVSLLSSTDGALKGLNGAVATADGSLWLNGKRGIINVAAGTLGQALQATSKGHSIRMPVRIFDENDGFPSGTIATDRNSIQVASDGKIWFAGIMGAYWLDPNNLQPMLEAPKTIIENVRAGTANYPEPVALQLPPSAGNLQVDYTAISLSMPDRTHFRYRLEGYDRAWQDAGTRRQAFYTKVGPGEYVFRVSAAIGDGPWNDAGPGLRVSIAPAFYQTWWFFALIAMSLIAALYVLHEVRVRRAMLRFSELHRERMEERERIARTLHDTILQSIQSVILRLGVLAMKMPPDSPPRQQIESLTASAVAVYNEGRDQVHELRASQTMHVDRAIEDAVAHLSPAFPGTQFHFRVEGEKVPLQTGQASEIGEIAREAIRNACQHAQASAINVTLVYTVDEVRLCVWDDGCGMPLTPAVGHWGLIGMKERARRIKGDLQIDSGPGRGTRVSLSVPLKDIYSFRFFASRITQIFSRKVHSESPRPL